MIGRRGFLKLGAGATAAAVLAGCDTSGDAPATGGTDPAATDTTTTPGDGAEVTVPSTVPDASAGASAADTALAAPGSPGLVDEAVFQTRVDAYLAFAINGVPAGDPTAINAFLARAGRDPDFEWPADAVTVDSLAATLGELDSLAPTRHSTIVELLWMLTLATGATASTTLDPALATAVDERLAATRYSPADALVAGTTDSAWFWSEPDRITCLAAEHLAGQRLADTTFTVSGLTGAEHASRAVAGIAEWVDERSRFGFFDWHSPASLLAATTALTALAELSADADVVVAAALALDLCLIDMAAHHHRGGFVAPRGHSLKRHTMSALDEPTFNVTKFVFDAATEPYQSTADPTVVAWCAARRYRPPQVVADIAADTDDVVVRERHGVFFDGAGPLVEHPDAPDGRDFTDPANVGFWWSLGATAMWPLVDAGVATADAQGLWDAAPLATLAAAADATGGDPAAMREWLQARATAVNAGFLSEANTYAFRDAKVSLASVLDHRFGELRDDVHAWHAAIDERAIVFTTHPRTDVADTTVWADDAAPGYWTGEASMPRSAQHQRTAVHVYEPRWDNSTDPAWWADHGYQPFTHAFFPQDAFDEVRQHGNWTIGNRGGGFIALWSWRTPHWREHDSTVVATGGMRQPFDLVADGGADNVWIVEVGTDAGGSFDDFVTAVTAIDPSVVRGDAGFTVSWTSPSAGLIDFSSSGPFSVEGVEQPLGRFDRHESPWGGIRWGDRQQTLFGTSATWTADFDAGTRSLTA